MTQEDKKLLLKELCERLPYNVMVQPAGSAVAHKVIGYDKGLVRVDIDVRYDLENVKLYLRPLSSMTEEEKKDLIITLLGKNDTKYFQVLPDGSIDNNDAAYQDLSNFNIHWINFDGVNTSTYIDWLNAHHFDYRGLIEKGLAIPVSKDNNPYGKFS